MENHKVLFYDKLSGIKELYEKVKFAIILSENFDPDREYYIAATNQMRAALDQILKAMDDNNDTITNEINEAKEHLERAGYDACEILASNIYINISNKMERYSPHIISHVFPEYYEEIKPIISEIKIETGKLRTEKKSINLAFDEYAQNIDKYIKFDAQIDKKIPAMEEYRRYERVKNWKYWALTILIAIVFLIIGKCID